MKRNKTGGFTKKLTFIVSAFISITLLTGCNRSESSIGVEEEINISIDSYSQESSTIKQFDLVDDEKSQIIVDEDNLLNGHWIAYRRANGIREYDPERHPDIDLIKFADGEGMIIGLFSKGIPELYSDFVFTDIKDDVQIGAGQIFESDSLEASRLNGHSQTSEITAVKANDEVTLIRKLSGEVPSVIESYILERISENDYESLQNEGPYISADIVESLVYRFNDMNKRYSEKLKKYFGTNYEWNYGDADSFGELGRGNELKLNEKQLEVFKGTLFNFNPTEYDGLFYSLAPLQDDFYLSKEDEELGFIVLQSKGGIADSILYAEDQGSVEAKNSLINLLMKATERYDYKIKIRVTDSQGDAYLGFQNGSVVFDRLEKQRNFEEFK